MPEIGEVKIGGRRRSYIWSACLDCGKERWVQLRVAKNVAKNLRCHKCANKFNNPHGERISHSCGYTQVWVSRDDFFYPMASKSSYVLEHRLVMAKSLSRCLLPWEIVHHKNGVKTDNRYDNLLLVNGGHNHIVDALVQSKIIKLIKRVKCLELENKKLKEELRNVNRLIGN